MLKQTKLIDFGRRSGLKVHPVSIGAMRLPEMEQAIPLVRQAIDAGMTYIDTSRGYGDSEVKLARALKDGYREKVILSTKWCPWIVKVEENDDTSADCTFKRILDSMQRLDVEYLDFYQIWNINSAENYALATKKGGMLDGIVRAMDEGLVKHVGFTTHDTAENVSRYIDEADWCEAILFTHNLRDKTYKENIAQAHDRGIATLVMNPVAGGLLAEDSPVISQTINDAVGIADPVEAAHRYLTGNPNIDTVLCGIVKPSDIASTLENFALPPLDQDQIKAVEAAMSSLTTEGIVAGGFCTNCQYCMPCPQGIRIPHMMGVTYYGLLLGLRERAQGQYDQLVDPNNESRSEAAAVCNQCGQCEDKCTQKLNITELLAQLDAEFGGK